MNHPDTTTKLPREFYDRSALTVARDLLGKVVIRRWRDILLAGMIVETEAYLGKTDAASHAARGKTGRNAVMFGPPGYAYVYLIYGRYYCLNFVTGPEGRAEAVLIRALEPVAGVGEMQTLRQTSRHRNLTSGPGKLCQALSIGMDFNGRDLTAGRLYVTAGKAVPAPAIGTSPRIGIRKAAGLPHRYFIRNNPYVSSR